MNLESIRLSERTVNANGSTVKLYAWKCTARCIAVVPGRVRIVGIRLNGPDILIERNDMDGWSCPELGPYSNYWYVPKHWLKDIEGGCYMMEES